MTAVAAGELRLIAAEPGLPGLAVLLDDRSLGVWARTHGLALPSGARVDRLRHKPGTRAQAAVDPGDGGPWWVVGAFARSAWDKARKDAAVARRAFGPEAVVLDEQRLLVLTPAAADRDLPALRRLATAPGARFLTHNPARRSVLALGGEVVKVHADPAVAERAARAARALGAAGIRTPVVRARDGVARTAFCAGRHPRGAEGRTALAELTARLARVDAAGQPVLRVEELRDAAAANLVALRHWAGAAATVAEQAQELAHRVRTLDLGPLHRLPEVFLHGDLSADQVLVDDASDAGLGPTLLDLDRAGRGPRGFDEASWWAAAVAAGEPGAVGVPGSSPLLALAAALRLPEPFRRRRPDWEARTADLLDLVENALGERW
ncbi:phosphotransferase [Kineococcus gynurae]|uniref:Phosphotransferase n=1 Tax=Kineococcus gynurae TaxID=452979 RepID=A0ABV5LXD1_9ACTN